MGGDPNGSPLVFLTSPFIFRKSNSFLYGGDKNDVLENSRNISRAR